MELRLTLALARHGFRNPQAILNARSAAKLGLPLACAMLDQESSGGLNEWGHDPTNFIGGFDRIGENGAGKNWGSAVTKAAYLAYKAQRAARGNQGVGPCQLTSPSLQDEADAAGGCWVPQHNMAVGFHYLHDLISEHGLLAGCVAYNGSGPAANVYGAHLVALANHYKTVGLGTTVGLL